LRLFFVFANITNFNPKFVTLILTSTISLNLYMEIILFLTHCICYYFYYLFISFHIESPLLIKVFFFSFSTILYLFGGLQAMWEAFLSDFVLNDTITYILYLNSFFLYFLTSLVNVKLPSSYKQNGS